MKPFLCLALGALFTVVSPLASAAIQCGEPCISLVREAHGLERKGQYQQAFDKYKAAQQADPQASVPVSLAAGLVFKLSTAAKGEQSAQLRNTARAMAERAAGMEPDDPVAQEVLRLLNDDGPSPLYVPGPKATRLLAEGEALFGEGKFAESLSKYEAAMALDPKASRAWVGAGDYHFVRRDWPRAEALFRRATEIEPLNAQAWRFLSDALTAQDKRAAAEAALYSAIAADPSQAPSWSKLALLRAGAGLPLKALALRRGVRVVQGADGKHVINIDAASNGKVEGQGRDATPDHALRLALGVSEVKLRSDDKGGAKSPFEIELESWRMALAIIGEANANGGRSLSAPALLQMQALARDGQLEPALLLLQFRQAYRPALDAWLAAHPGGVKGFIDRYGLRP